MLINFSYTQEIYEEKFEWERHVLNVRQEKKQFTYENCSYQLVGTKDKKTHVVLRRINSRYTDRLNDDYILNLMMGFTVETAHKPTPDTIEVDGKNVDAWTINFDVLKIWDNPKIRPITEVKIWIDRKNKIVPPDFNNLYQDIISEKPETKFFDSGIEENSEFLPVIYQPRIDAWKNFLRDIHIHPLENKNEYEITLIFEDEKLRAHGPLDYIYRFIRIILHKRINDVETFCINLDEEYFRFPSIYSNKKKEDGKIHKYTIFDDNIHEHKPEKFPKGIPKVPIKYFFQTRNHPIIFVNTSNHAMAEGDSNHDFWKWEYTPWSKKIPINCYNPSLSRAGVDDSYRLIKAKFRKFIFPIKEKICGCAN